MEESYRLIEITLSSGKKIEATAEHPFYIKGKGWNPAGSLKVGQVLMLHNGTTVVVEEVDSRVRLVRVFNFSVANAHNYFVGGDGVLVHNASSKKSGVPEDSFVPNPSITKKYKRPSAAGPTAAQRRAVQGQACVDCGAITNRQVADHIDPLVVEYYREGNIDVAHQSSVSAVQAHCPTCSNIQGGQLGAFGKKMKKICGL